LEEHRAKDRERKRQWRKENPEKSRESSRRQRDKNPEKARERNRRYREKNLKKVRAYSRQWRKENAARVREYNRQWAKENREQRRESARRRYAKNLETARANSRENGRRRRKEKPEKSRESTQRWREKNPEKSREISRQWSKANPVKCRANTAKRKAAKLKRTPLWADHAQIAEFHLVAAFLSKKYSTQLDVEHVIPLQGKLVSGLNVPGNLRVFPSRPNSIKGNRFRPWNADEPTCPGNLAGFERAMARERAIECVARTQRGTP
jgi:hypothetical protein